MSEKNSPAVKQVIRPFIPSRDWAQSRQFYTDLGAREIWTNGKDLAHYNWGDNSFYLQNFYLKDWAENTMFQLRVEDVDEWWTFLSSLQLPERYGVRIRAPFHTDWGSYEIHLHDPAGVLWFFAKFED